MGGCASSSEARTLFSAQSRTRNIPPPPSNSVVCPVSSCRTAESSDGARRGPCAFEVSCTASHTAVPLEEVPVSDPQRLPGIPKERDPHQRGAPVGALTSAQHPALPMPPRTCQQVVVLRALMDQFSHVHFNAYTWRKASKHSSTPK